MFINSAVEHAIVVLKELKEANDIVRGSVICNKHNLSQNYVDQICRKLRTNGYIKSYRGPGGGYKIIRTDVNLMELIDLFSTNVETSRYTAVGPILSQVKTKIQQINAI